MNWIKKNIGEVLRLIFGLFLAYLGIKLAYIELNVFFEGGIREKLGAIFLLPLVVFLVVVFTGPMWKDFLKLWKFFME